MRVIRAARLLENDGDRDETQTGYEEVAGTSPAYCMHGQGIARTAALNAASYASKQTATLPPAPPWVVDVNVLGLRRRAAPQMLRPKRRRLRIRCDSMVLSFQPPIRCSTAG